MGFLDALSNGLRGAGSVLNSQVEGQVAGEHQDKLRQQQNMKNLVAQRVIGGIENGSIDPEQGQQALAQLGVQLPPGAIGASPEAEARKTAAANEAKFRQEIAALGPGATQEQLAQVAARYSKPDAVMTSQTASLDRQQRLAVEVQRFREAEQNKIDLATQRGADQRELRQMQIDADRRLREFMIANRQAPAPSITTIADPNDPTKGQVIDARTGRVIGAAPPAKDNGRGSAALDASVRRLGTDFEKAGLSQMIPVVDLAVGAVSDPKLLPYLSGPKSINPDFALNKATTDARQAIQKLFNITLKDRSGGAVTDQEFERLKEEFARGVFKKPEQLQTAVLRAQEIVNAHYAGIAATHGKDALGKYNDNLESIGGRRFEPSMAGKPKGATDSKAVLDAADAILGKPK